MQRNKDGMVYRGRKDRVHIADGKRAAMGAEMAREMTHAIRSDAMEFDAGAWEKPLCPGCYMTAVFNMAVTLAKANGQSLTELGRTLAGEFERLANGGPDVIEEVHVVLDGD